jgi:tetratricopeptide (TPR) repeat protein
MIRKFFIYLFITQYVIANPFGNGYDNREIRAYDNFLFEYHDNDNYMYFLNNKNKTLCDIYEEDGGLMKTKLIYYNKKKDILAIVTATHHNLPSPDIQCEAVNAMWYNTNIYKKFNTFFLKLLPADSSLDGYDGLVMCHNNTYKYKTIQSLKKKVNQLQLSDKLILFSLENFLKSYTGIGRLKPKFSFKNSAFGLSSLKDILNTIKIAEKTLTPYNNIAYYLQKAGANKEAIFLLEKIIKKFPNRTVAYYNLGDAYWALGEKDKAIKAYTTYIEQMCDKGLQKKIPKEVLKRVEVK